MTKAVKFIVKTLCCIIGKAQYYLHKLFPKHIAILTCYGCLNDDCKYRATKHNEICYYHTKKNRKLYK